MRFLILLSVVASFVLTALNPGMEEFEDFIAEQSEEVVRKETGNSALGRALSGASSEIARAYIDRIADRENYLLFSIYTVDIDGRERSENDWRFLGIADRFFELERPEMLERR